MTMPIPAAAHACQHTLEQLGQIILGKAHALRLALSCILARGHLLIEDIPGVGKTTLAHALATVLGLNFQRIQFTSDLLPADLLGVSIYDASNGVFRFHAGPIFAQVVLADEINRAPPKTQSALLEAMEEHQVTLDGVSHPMPQPFFVIATQNPSQQIGTYALPESQLDRFLMRISLGLPDAQAERTLLRGEDRRHLLTQMPSVLDANMLVELQEEVGRVHLSDALLDYVQALLAATRAHADFTQGLSPRGGLSLLAAAKAWAFIDRRSFVQPEDIQAVFPHIAGHRLQTRDGGNADAGALRGLIESVALS